MATEEMGSPDSQKSEHIRQRLVRNSATIMGCRVVTAATSLLAVPFITGRIGLPGFGLWETFVAIATVTAMFQQALVATLLYRFAQAFGAGRRDEMRRLVRIAVALTLITVAVVVPIVWAIRWRLVDGLNAPPDLYRDAAWLLPCVVFVLLISSINDVMGAYVSGNQQMGSVVVVQSAGIVVQYTVAIGAMYAGLGFAGLLVGLVAVTLWNGGNLFRMLKGLDPEVTLAPSLPRKDEMRELAKYGGLLVVGQVSQILRDQTDKLILASVASPTWAGFYGIAARLAALVLETSRFFYNPLVASAGALHASGDWAGVRRLYGTMITAVGLGAGLIAVILGASQERVITLWMGRPVPESSLMLLLLLAGNTAAVILTGPGTAICRAAGKVWIETLYVVANLVANLILTIVLVKTIGAIGTVIASGVTWGLSSLLFSAVMHRYIDLPIEATRRARLFAVLTLASAALVSLVSKALPVAHNRAQALWSVMVIAAVATVVYLGVAILLGLVPRDLLSRVSKKLSRRLGIQIKTS